MLCFNPHTNATASLNLRPFFFDYNPPRFFFFQRGVGERRENEWEKIHIFGGPLREKEKE